MIFLNLITRQVHHPFQIWIEKIVVLVFNFQKQKPKENDSYDLQIIYKKIPSSVFFPFSTVKSFRIKKRVVATTQMIFLIFEN